MTKTNPSVHIDTYFSTENLHVSFGATDVVKGLSIHLKKGEIGCLLGLSGCGKTTALRAIAGLETAKQGNIQLNQQTLTDTEQNIALMPAKRGMGMVFQDYALFSHLTVRQNIEFGLKPLKHSKAKRTARVDEMLELVELSKHAHKRIHELSGGQQQRIALARALAPAPDLLLLDEPFSNLDMMLRETLASRVRDILKQTDTTAILVTHDQHEAFAIADKVGVMQHGKLAQWATPSQLYHEPATPFVAEFVGEGAMINGTIHQGRIHTGLGVIEENPIPIHARLHDGHLPNHHPQAMPTNPEAPANPENATSIGTRRYPDGTQVKILVRPDDVIHDDSSPTHAQVVGRVFRGANYLYRLRLDNGEEILSLVPSHHDHAVGSSIGYRPLLEHVVMFCAETVADVLEGDTVWHRI